MNKNGLKYDDLNRFIEQINEIEDSAEKSVLLKKIWSQLHKLSDDVSRNNNFVSRVVTKEFFSHYNKYNDYLHLYMCGTCTTGYIFGVPIFYISSTKHAVSFVSIESINEEVEHVLENIQKDINNYQKNIKTLNNILDLSDWQLFLREIKLKSFITPSTIKKGRKVLSNKLNNNQKWLSQSINEYNLISKNKQCFMSFVEEVIQYIAQAFTEEDYLCKTEELDSSTYLHDAVSLFLNRDNLKGSGLSIKRDEGYWEKEKIPFVGEDTD